MAVSRTPEASHHLADPWPRWQRPTSLQSHASRGSGVSPLTLAPAQACRPIEGQILAPEWLVVQVCEDESIQPGPTWSGQVLFERLEARLGRWAGESARRLSGRLGRPEHHAPTRQLDCGFLKRPSPCGAGGRSQAAKQTKPQWILSQGLVVQQ